MAAVEARPVSFQSSTAISKTFLACWGHGGLFVSGPKGLKKLSLNWVEWERQENVQSIGIRIERLLCTTLNKTLTTKNIGFLSWTPLVRLKSVVFTPKWYNKHTHPFHLRVPLSFDWASSLVKVIIALCSCARHLITVAVLLSTQDCWGGGGGERNQQNCCPGNFSNMLGRVPPKR